MNRIINLFSRYSPLSEEGEEFLHKYGRIKSYNKGEIFIQQNHKNNLFGLLLDGLIAFSITNQQQDIILTKIITPYNYFVGSKHIYSNSSALENIHFIKNSEVFIISNILIQQAIRNFPEFNLMYHILKQQYLTICNNVIHIQQLKNELKIIYFYHYFPSLKNQLTVSQICSLLGFSNSNQYYISLEKYHRHTSI